VVPGRAPAAKLFRAFYRHQIAFPAISKVTGVSRGRQRSHVALRNFFVVQNFSHNISGKRGRVEPINPPLKYGSVNTNRAVVTKMSHFLSVTLCVFIHTL